MNPSTQPTIVQFNQPTDPIDEQMQTLTARKTKLEELIVLQESVLKLEKQVFLGTDIISRQILIICNVACRHYGITIPLIVNPSRERRVLVPRFAAMYLAKKLLTTSYAAIGRVFGNRDHGTVLNACQRVEEMVTAEKGFSEDLAIMESECKRELGL